MTTLRPLSDDSIITVDVQCPISGHTLAGTPVDFADAATQHAIATAVTTALATIHGPAKPIPGAHL